MLIPSIDLKNGRVVQLVQGERLALESADLDGWISRFAPFPKVQLIDLDAAMGSGSNDALVRRVAPQLPCRIGGGIRSIDRAREVLDYGAQRVIVSSALFKDGLPDVAFARSLAHAVGAERIIAAVDSKGGRVVIRGWTEPVEVTAVEAARVLEPYCGEFLYTHVDREGLMTGTDMEAVRQVAAATTRPVTAAGGITTQTEIDALDAAGIDAVVGMAIYTGTLSLDEPDG
ncbi:MAG: 1-(5-phosphoribosyl)-5-[(5-phosphoribosylamino)methylideneamino] imidazole-4-carboxamide isomerase [Vicinamibacterales bacterium]|nr:1-(5-phosphoribosyl)-5-[(5-phosphoribosylamino)methylideneamino] imidazole-4-carboxamide isomerase [Vicinamibacterales bacterium]